VGVPLSSSLLKKMRGRPFLTPDGASSFILFLQTEFENKKRAKKKEDKGERKGVKKPFPVPFVFVF
jgi:hypothetical protein